MKVGGESLKSNLQTPEQFLPQKTGYCGQNISVYCSARSLRSWLLSLDRWLVSHTGPFDITGPGMPISKVEFVSDEHLFSPWFALISPLRRTLRI